VLYAYHIEPAIGDYYTLMGQRCNPAVAGLPADWSLVVEGMGFEAHDGKRVTVAAGDQRRTITISGGRFRERFPGLGFHLPPTSFFVDLNDDGGCQPGIDLVGDKSPTARIELFDLERWATFTPGQAGMEPFRKCPL